MPDYYEVVQEADGGWTVESLVTDEVAMTAAFMAGVVDGLATVSDADELQEGLMGCYVVGGMFRVQHINYAVSKFLQGDEEGAIDALKVMGE